MQTTLSHQQRHLIAAWCRQCSNITRKSRHVTITLVCHKSLIVSTMSRCQFHGVSSDTSESQITGITHIPRSVSPQSRICLTSVKVSPPRLCHEIIVCLLRQCHHRHGSLSPPRQRHEIIVWLLCYFPFSLK